MSVLYHVECAVRTAQIHKHIAYSKKKNKNSDDFRRPRNGSSPFGVTQAQDGRDQSAGVAYPDKEYEVGYVESPIHRSIQASDAEAIAILKQPGEHRPEHDCR